MVPMAVEAGGEDKHKGHHDRHSSHMNMGDSYPSNMFMGGTEPLNESLRKISSTVELPQY